MSLTKRLILALAMLAGLAPAFAQSPPPVPALPDTERRTAYSISASTCSCAVGFQLYGDSTDFGDWLQVWLNGKNVAFNDPSFGWTITSPTGSLGTIPRPITNAVLTFNQVQTGTVQIVGARRPRRTSQFQESQPVPTRNVNQVFSDIIATQRELWDKTNDITGRGLFSQPGNTVGPLPLPAVCVNAFLAFDATGLNPQCQQILSAGTLVTPGSVVDGNFAVWNGTTGKILKDGGNLASPPAIGGTTPGSGKFSSLTDTAIAGSTQCVQANSAGVLSGTGSGCAGGAGATVDNLLQNNQWRLWCCTPFSTKQNAAGTANQANVSATGFSISTQDPVFTTANTQTIRVGDIAIVSNIVSFWGFAGAGFINCAQIQCNGSYVTAARVTNVIANTSVTLHSPFGSGISPAASAAATIIPIVPLDSGSTTGPDGWTKTATLVATVDDWGAAATPASTVYPGCERPLLLRKGITGNELLSFNIASSQLPLWQGQTVTFGVAIYHRIQGGGSTGNTYVQDSAGTTFSAALTGASLGGYQFLTVTRTISQTATSVQIGIQPSGNSGDVFDVCLPTAAFVPSMLQSQLHTNSYEKTVAFSHWNPPLLTPDIVNFPTAAFGGAAPTLYGYNTNDLEAMTFGEVHNTVGHVWAKLEWKTATSWLGCNIFMGGFINTTTGALTFGLQAAGQVNNVVFPTSMSPVPLYHVGGTFSLYTDCNNAGGVIPTAGTWDFTDIDNNGPTSQQ